MKIRRILLFVAVFVLAASLLCTSAFADGNAIVIFSPTPSPQQVPDPDSPSGSVSIYAVPPTITKNPTSETVFVGNNATFTASASGAVGYNWYLVNPLTGGTTVLSSGAGASSSVTVSNANLAKDGSQVYCEFYNDYGTVSTSGAFLNVRNRNVNITEIVDPDASPTPSPTPTPTPTPSPTPTSYSGANAGRTTGTGGGRTNGNGTSNSSYSVGNSNNTSVGTIDSANMPGVESDGTLISTTSAANASGGAAKNSHVGAYILAVLAGLVIIGSVLVMALYMKGKISLGKFEQFLGGSDGGQGSGAEGEFYNPDDFKDDHNV